MLPSPTIPKSIVLIAAKYTKQLVNRKQPIKNTLNRLLVACMQSSNIIVKQLSKSIINPIGKKNHPKKMQILVMNIAKIRYIISTLMTNKANFKNNFNPSVIGVSSPYRNNAGPILI